MPAPDHGDPSDEAEDASTKFFIKGASPDKTQILPDRHELMGFERDPDAPVAVDEDLLKTTPNLRAAPIPRPPRH